MGIEGLSAEFVPDFQTYPRRCFYMKSHLKSIVTCDNLEGWWDGLGGGRWEGGSRGGNIHIPMANSC